MMLRALVVLGTLAAPAAAQEWPESLPPGPHPGRDVLLFGLPWRGCDLCQDIGRE